MGLILNSGKPLDLLSLAKLYTEKAIAAYKNQPKLWGDHSASSNAEKNNVLGNFPTLDIFTARRLIKIIFRTVWFHKENPRNIQHTALSGANYYSCPATKRNLGGHKFKDDGW